MVLSLNIIMGIRGEKFLALCCVSFPEETRHMPIHPGGPMADQSNGYIKVQFGELTIFIGFTNKSMGKELQEKG